MRLLSGWQWKLWITIRSLYKVIISLPKYPLSLSWVSFNSRWYLHLLFFWTWVGWCCCSVGREVGLVEYGVPGRKWYSSGIHSSQKVIFFYPKGWSLGGAYNDAYLLADISAELFVCWVYNLKIWDASSATSWYSTSCSQILIDIYSRGMPWWSSY